MPLDYNLTQATIIHNWSLRRVQNWNLKFCWIPRKCHLTKKSLWGKMAFHGSLMIAADYGEPIYEHYWIDKHEFIWWNLKGKK